MKNFPELDPANPNYTPSNINTFEAYIALPLEQRTRKVWWWPGLWYKTTRGMIIEPREFSDFSSGNFGKLKDFLKKEFPIQYWLRNIRNFAPVQWFRFRWWDLQEAWQPVKRFFKPYHSELRRVIPREWCDLDSIIVNFLYTCVVSYIDNERAFDRIVWDSDEEHISDKKMLEEIYDFVKSGRAALLKKIEDSYPTKEERKLGLPYEQLYAKNIAAEKELKNLDDKYLSWILNHRERLWT